MKRIIKIRDINIILLVFLSASLTGCDAIYRFLQKEGAQEKELLGEVLPFERNQYVQEVQKLLKLYGYRIGTADGILGANTRDAIQVFQKDLGLKPTRFVDHDTWEMLHVFDGYGLVQDAKVNFSAVQQALKNAGFDPGPVDGNPGRKTFAAIRAFQKSKGLNPDGKVGFRTLWYLADHLPFHET